MLAKLDEYVFRIRALQKTPLVCIYCTQASCHLFHAWALVLFKFQHVLQKLHLNQVDCQ